jgi:hypothetical protein
VNSNQAAALACQESINAGGVNIGANPMLGVTAAHDATIRAAAVTYQQAKLAAYAAQQATIQVAKDLLRSQNDFGPA